MALNYHTVSGAEGAGNHKAAADQGYDGQDGADGNAGVIVGEAHAKDGAGVGVEKFPPANPVAGGDDNEQGGSDGRHVDFYVAGNGDVALPEPEEDQVEAQHDDQDDYGSAEEPSADEAEEGEGKYVEVHALVEDGLRQGRYGAGGFVHLGEWGGIQVLEHRFPSTRSCRTDGGGRNDGGNGSGQSQHASYGIVSRPGEGGRRVASSEAEYQIYVGN